MESPLVHGRLGFVAAHHHLFSLNDGQQDVLPSGPAPYKRVGVHFVRQGVEQHDGTGCLEARLLLQLGQHPDGERFLLLGRQFAHFYLDLLAQVFFVLHGEA